MPPTQPEESMADGRRPASAWLAAVHDAERRGELLLAFDLAERGLDQHPGDPALRYQAVLALARTGSTVEAQRRFTELGLAAIDTEDVAALEARIQKDGALAAVGGERQRLAATAAAAYKAIGDRTAGYFPAINAATLTLVAGDAAGARTLAQHTLALVAESDTSSYFAHATEAEASLLLGDHEGVRAALRIAAALHRGDFAALATTRRQLRMICDVLAVDPAILAALAGPAVVHYCGHRMSGPGEDGAFRPGQQADVARRMTEVLQLRPAGFAYGSLASGGDILWAETLLGHGCELHVVLPFALDEFVATSVAPAGDGWVARFEQCMAGASSLNYATEDAYLDDDVLYGYCSQLAMGLALLRARHLDADVHQLALWDGGGPTGSAGTAADVARWQTTGHDVVIVAPTGPAVTASPMATIKPTPPLTGSPPWRRPGRVVRSMLIGDIRGYSRLSDEQLPAFSQVVMKAFAAVLSQYDDEVEYRNTWGDALFAVLSTTPVAARCALDLQDALAALDLESVGLPPRLAFSLSGHVGPVFPIVDPVLESRSFMGSHVSRTARIEPVTPPGSVYVTETFAAALELSGSDDIECDYVGHIPAAKNYGRLRMYRILRRLASDRPGPASFEAGSRSSG